MLTLSVNAVSFNYYMSQYRYRGLPNITFNKALDISSIYLSCIRTYVHLDTLLAISKVLDYDNFQNFDFHIDVIN